MRTLPALLALVLLGACGPTTHDTPHDAEDGDGGDGSGGLDGEACRAPQMMVLFDRTGTMHRDLTGTTPADTAEGHAAAKFTIAIDALDDLLATNGLDQALRLGLAMFPRDPGGGQCISLSQRLAGGLFSNPSCEGGEVPVAPALGTAAQIASYLDPETTTLCNTTPTGSGLETAKAGLDAVAIPGVDQYIMLVTDGADFYDSCPTPDPIAVLRTLEAAHVKTFIVGFGAQATTPQGVNPPLLNRMACAGHTAKHFATACMALPTGGYDAIDPDGAALYYDAADGAALAAALRDVAREICCGCVL